MRHALRHFAESPARRPHRRPLPRVRSSGALAAGARAGGDDQITVVPHVDTAVVAANLKPFLGYSDNTNLQNLLWTLGVPNFYGGSTQVHLGPGQQIDEVHLRSLLAAITEGGDIELTDPGESEDIGVDWGDARALGEGGVLKAAAGILIARPPVSSQDSPAMTETERQALRDAQRDTIFGQVEVYNPDAVVCNGVPFGHTRPQWIVPYGGRITLDGHRQAVTAHYR